MKNKIFLVIVLSGLLAPAAFAQTGDNDGCSNSTLQGDYAFRVSGQILSPPPAVPVDREGVAMTRFDGSGKLSQVDFVMSEGVALMGPTDPLTGFHVGETGWYVVNPDCTGMAEIRFPKPPTASSGAVIDLMFVIGDHGRVIHAIVGSLTPPGASAPVPASIHSDAEKVGEMRRNDD